MGVTVGRAKSGPGRKPHLTAHVLHCLRQVCMLAEQEVRAAKEEYEGKGYAQHVNGVSLPTVERARVFVDDLEDYRSYHGKEVRRGPVRGVSDKVYNP